MWGTKALASMATMYPNAKQVQIDCLPDRALSHATT
jgi:hypothetical protein